MDKDFIIIVDDNPNNLQVLGKILKNEGCHVEFAIDGKTALEWIKNRKFDLILLDIMMPGMDGFEVCRIIRSEEKYNDIPIIFLTAETSKEMVLKGFETGAQDYITKPFDPRELLARVRPQLEIKHNREQLQMLNKNLEDKVRERTLQLQQTNEELKEAHEKLLELDMAKSEFLQLISHEIRTPLNGILGPLQLIRERIESDDIGRLLEVLDISVSRLEKFSYDALLITQLRTKREISPEYLALKKIIRDCLDELSERLQKKDVRPDIREVPEDLHVQGEYKLLKTCLINILNNAVGFSPEKGMITVKAFRKDGLTVCEIIDKGPGFPDKMLVKSFDLFSTDEPNINGKLGLGLYLSKLIMDAHSGTIEAGNRDKGGAVVRLTFG